MTDNRTFTFRVDEELKAAFAEIAKAEDRTAAQLLRHLMRTVVQDRKDRVDHDVWFRREVQQGMREADDLQVTRDAHENVHARRERRRGQLRRHAAEKTA